VEEQFWSLCVAKGITVISRAKSSEQNDDKMNNSDDVILRQGSKIFKLVDQSPPYPATYRSQVEASSVG